MEPQPRLGLAALTQVAFDGGDMAPLRTELISHCMDSLSCAGSLMDLSTIAQLQGDLELGLQLQAQAFETCRMFQTYREKPARKTLLVYAAPVQMGGNTPVEFLLPSDAFEIVTYYPDPNAPDGMSPPLPFHDVAFCAAPADAEDADVVFENIRKMSKSSDTKVLNLPNALVKPERDTLPELLGRVSGLRLPKTLRIGREDLRTTVLEKSEAQKFNGMNGYPYVVRPVGSHAGLGLAKIETPREFEAYLFERNEDSFFVCEFINYASQHDGRFRKYRIVLVDGKAYPCHMAISDRWDVWYMNSDMRASEEKRLEEAEFMDQFGSDFGKRHQITFEALAAGIGLDYFGLDCAEDENGNLVVFEVDNALIVHDMDCKETFPYKEQHMSEIFKAFEAMLSKSCRTGIQKEMAFPITPKRRIWSENFAAG